MDPTATLQIVKKTEQGLEDLEQLFETCDLAIYYVAAVLDASAPALSDSVRDVAAREGGHRTKPFAQAHEATVTLRGTVADFVRFGEEVVRDLGQFTDAVVHGTVAFLRGTAEFGKDVVHGAAEFGGDVLDGAVEFGGDVLDGAVEFGGDVLDGAVELGKDVVDGVEELGEDLVSGVKKLGNVFGL